MRETVAVLVWAVLLGTPHIGLKIFLLLPATLAHELSHWIVALFAGARPGFPSILPKKAKEGWVLGSVSFDVKSGTAAFIALAPPLLCGGLGVLIFLAGSEANPTSLLAQGVALAYLAHAATPSPADLAIALKDPVGLAGALLCLTALAGLAYPSFG